MHSFFRFVCIQIGNRSPPCLQAHGLGKFFFGTSILDIPRKNYSHLTIKFNKIDCFQLTL